jgi:hypothetical protein
VRSCARTLLVLHSETQEMWRMLSFYLLLLTKAVLSCLQPTVVICCETFLVLWMICKLPISNLDWIILSHSTLQIHSMQSVMVVKQRIRVLHKSGSQCLCMGSSNTETGTQTERSHKNVERFWYCAFIWRSYHWKFRSQLTILVASQVAPWRDSFWDSKPNIFQLPSQSCQSLVGLL